VNGYPSLVHDVAIAEMKNLRQTQRPKTWHEDFEYARGLPESARTDDNRHWRRLKHKIDNGHFDIAMKFWGDVGSVSKPDSSASGSFFYIRFKHPDCERIFSNFDTSTCGFYSIGASQITNDELIETYERMKNEI